MGALVIPLPNAAEEPPALRRGRCDECFTLNVSVY